MKNKVLVLHSSPVRYEHLICPKSDSALSIWPPSIKKCQQLLEPAYHPLSNMLRSLIVCRALRPPAPTIFKASLATKSSGSSRKVVSRRRPPPPSRIPQRPSDSPAQEKGAPSSPASVSDALRDTKNEDNNLLAPVHVPEDPDGILNERHPVASILANSAIVVQRQIEMMNVMIGFEQANRYIIMDGHGNHIGYMAERESGMGSTMARQFFKTHRSFTTHVFDRNEREVLRVSRWI